ARAHVSDRAVARRSAHAGSADRGQHDQRAQPLRRGILRQRGRGDSPREPLGHILVRRSRRRERPAVARSDPHETERASPARDHSMHYRIPIKGASMKSASSASLAIVAAALAACPLQALAARTLTRNYEPVVLTGAQTPTFAG